MLHLEKKGILSPYALITSVITGGIFPLLGSLIALDLQVVKIPYIEGIVLVIIGGFIAHWITAHTIHDLFHFHIEKRSTLSKKTLKILLIGSLILLLTIAIYLTVQRGLPVFVFAAIGLGCCLYAEGLLHHESQMAIGAFFLVIGGFYVQAGTLNLDSIIYGKVLCIALFSFFSQYGWLLMYRLNDYGWDEKFKNRSILVAKIGLLFLIVYFFL
jgi:hypothetical protein